MNNAADQEQRIADKKKTGLRGNSSPPWRQNYRSLSARKTTALGQEDSHRGCERRRRLLSMSPNDTNASQSETDPTHLPIMAKRSTMPTTTIRVPISTGT